MIEALGRILLGLIAGGLTYLALRFGMSDLIPPPIDITIAAVTFILVAIFGISMFKNLMSLVDDIW